MISFALSMIACVFAISSSFFMKIFGGGGGDISLVWFITDAVIEPVADARGRASFPTL